MIAVVVFEETKGVERSLKTWRECSMLRRYDTGRQDTGRLNDADTGTSGASLNIFEVFVVRKDWKRDSRAGS